MLFRSSSSDAPQGGDEDKPPGGPDADATVIKQEVKTEACEGRKEPLGEAADRKPAEAEEGKSSGKSSKREHGPKTGSHGDSDSSATCSADEVEESDTAEKNR